MARLRAKLWAEKRAIHYWEEKLEKADALAEVANNLYKAWPLEQDGHYYSLNKAIKEYRGGET